MRRPDDFPKPVRQAVALRAGYRCSFESCDKITVGPTDDSAMGYAQVGVAAHIHAASPGGKRFLNSMTSEERKHIDNAVWMCSIHGTLIDQDETTYTAEKIRSMKASHEAIIALELRRDRGRTNEDDDLLALGPDIIGLGQLVGASGRDWTVRVQHFVRGDLSTLIAFSENFNELPSQARHVLLNGLGDGRVISQPPEWRKHGRAIEVVLRVEPAAIRERAQNLGEDLKFDLVENDLTGDLDTVSGIEALPQKIQLCLWPQQGRLPWAKDFGTRTAEYFSLFKGSPWFDRLISLEVVRMAAIPRSDSLTGEEYTPFQCVKRVKGVELLNGEATGPYLPVRLTLDVVGIGEWTHDFSLAVSDYPFAPS